MASPALQPATTTIPGRAQSEPHACRRAAQTQDRHVLVVCAGEECRSRGSSDLLTLLRSITPFARTEVRVSTSRCLGHCAAAPAMVEDGSVLRWVSLRRLRVELMRLGIV